VVQVAHADRCHVASPLIAMLAAPAAPQGANAACSHASQQIVLGMEVIVVTESSTQTAAQAGAAAPHDAVSPGAPAKRRPSWRRRPAAPPTIRVSPTSGPSYAAAAAAARVIDALGSNTVADLLGVARSQPSRWRSGEEGPSSENRKKLSDLDHVLDRLLAELHPDQAGLWLTGPNPHFTGARP